MNRFHAAGAAEQRVPYIYYHEAAAPPRETHSSLRAFFAPLRETKTVA